MLQMSTQDGATRRRRHWLPNEVSMTCKRFIPNCCRRSQRTSATMGAIAAFFMMIVASCESPQVRVTERSGNALPESLAFPVMAGSANEIADQICRWASSNQQPYQPLDSVALTRVYGPDDGRYGAESVLTVFLQNAYPRELTIALDPAILTGHGVEAQQVVELVDRAGWWTLRKRDLVECASPQSGHLIVRRDALTLCIEVRRLEAPPMNVPEAEYRDLHFVLDVGWAQQPLNVQVMTLHLDGRLIGRSIRAVLWAEPADFGRVRRVCEPAPVVVAFESAGEQQ